jgi:hypothetical protein
LSHRHADEVGARVLPGPVDREPEGRQLLVRRQLAQLDVAGDVADERHHVHAASFVVRCDNVAQ